MIQKLRTAILSLSLLFTFATPMLATATVSAADPPVQTGINNCLKQGSNIDLSNVANNTTNCPNNTVSGGGTDFTAIVKKIINILSVIVGAIAVIMIIYAGFRYVTSAGSDSAVKSARDAILYAIVGLVIVALAQVIVHFVLSNVAG